MAAVVGIRGHTWAYVGIRGHTRAYAGVVQLDGKGGTLVLNRGLYEQVVNQSIRDAVRRLDARAVTVDQTAMDAAEADVTLAQYMAGVIKSTLGSFADEDSLIRGIDLCNRLIDVLVEETGDGHFRGYRIDADGQLLLAIRDAPQAVPAPAASTLSGPATAGPESGEPHATPHVRRSDSDPRPALRPLTPLSRTSLFTGSGKEPSLIGELKRELLTCDRVDMLVSFIRWSGLRLLIDELRTLTQSVPLRILTTAYMGATDIKAIDELTRLPNTSIKISYDVEHTRLHAKAYLFQRDSGFSTAYIGSSNLSRAALSSGLEWNVKVTAHDLPETWAKVAATFEGYWNDPQFVTYTSAQRSTFLHALGAERQSTDDSIAYVFDVTPYPFQTQILQQLAAERTVHGRFRNLVVAATGTGKTVISAFDYKRYCAANPERAHRLLFVAHREEILRQSLACFRGILHDQNFAELFVGGREPADLGHLFVSVQTLNSRLLTARTPSDFYDFIVVDEFHHAAAATYKTLLDHFRPAILLGLTATPERMDGEDITAYFDHHIAAEIRLPEAIERGLLAPFQYFGVSDSVDLGAVRWRRGAYDPRELSNLYTGNRQRADLIVHSLRRYMTDVDQIIGLGFCVSVDHALFMAEFFTAHAIPSRAVHAGSTKPERAEARRWLESGQLRFLFVVDLYNEGVDIPQINTVLFLRPTESLTVFLQQLGRGLRLPGEKECLTVLAFIGQSHTRYRFEEKFAALLGPEPTRTSLRRQLTEGFSQIPRGCYIQLERVAREHVLATIRQSVRTRSGLASRIATFTEDTGRELTLANFLNHYQLTARDLYGGSSPASFARLCAQAGLRDDFHDPDETWLTKALVRVAACNSRRLISFLLDLLGGLDGPGKTGGPSLEDSLTETQRTFLLMFHYTIWREPVPNTGCASLSQSVGRLRQNPVLLAEIVAVLRFMYEGIDFVDVPVGLGFDCPLDLHCTYTLDQILSATGVFTPDRKPAMREGVRYLRNRQVDLLFVTLNKSDKDYSPTTMYQDYVISETLFHWQSQGSTDVESETGRRYLHHRQAGNRIALFVREYRQDAAGTLPYTFLGEADYLSRTGSRPIGITWRLQHALPASLLQRTNHLTVG